MNCMNYVPETAFSIENDHLQEFWNLFISPVVARITKWPAGAASFSLFHLMTLVPLLMPPLRPPRLFSF